MTIGEYMRHIRKSKGLTIRGVAKSVGYSPTHLYNIEIDTYLPGLPVLRAISEVLGVNFIDLAIRAGHIDAIEIDDYIKWRDEDDKG